MAWYAYKDRARTEEIYAINTPKQDIRRRFYCPTPKCDAHMYICGIDGVSSAYFGATLPKHPHIEDCSVKRSNGFNPKNHDESGFDFSEALNSMFIPARSMKKKENPPPHDTGESQEKPLRTIRQIYDMCRSYACTRTYNNALIWKMLLDDRSEYLHSKGVFGLRIIESKVKAGRFYEPDKKEIRVVAPISSKKYEFILKFEDETLFAKMRDLLFNNRKNIILVAGDWISSGNVFKANISSSKQVKPIKE